MEKRKPTAEELTELRALAQKHREAEAAIGAGRADFLAGKIDLVAHTEMSLRQMIALIETIFGWIREVIRLMDLGFELDLKLEASFLEPPAPPSSQRCCQ